MIKENNVTTVRGLFATREDADQAVEHLVQEHGINRADIFVGAAGARNTSGAAPSRGDASEDAAEGSSLKAALRGPIEVSADVARAEIAKAEEAFRSAGASDVVIR